MCDIDCRFLACRAFTSKNEKWRGFCMRKKILVADISAYKCNVAIQQDLFSNI